MKNEIFVLIRGAIVLASLAILMIVAGLIWDVEYLRYPLTRINADLSFNQLDYNSWKFIVDMTNRGLNQVLATTFTVVAIAVPLTANLYSLKFLEFFIKDTVNAFMLTLVVSADIFSFWVVYSTRDKPTLIPVFQLHVAFSLLVLCLTLIFPYLYYVFRFLHPQTLLRRLQAEIESYLQAASRRRGRATVYHAKVAEGIEHIANIAIRSIDRSDRTTAIECVLTLEQVMRAYWDIKARMPADWFSVDKSLFLGFSSKAVDEFNASHSWVEMKTFSQLRQVLSAAIPRTHDVIDVIAKTLRKLGMETAARTDSALHEIVMEYFNTFIRLGLTRKDPRSVFSLFDHYRTFAEALNSDYPEFVLEVAYYFEYYGHVARDYQLPFIAEVVAHDLGALVQTAWQAQAANRQKLLERFLRYDLQSKSPLPGVKKAQALLASYFLLAGYPESADLIRRNFRSLDSAFIAALKDDLLHIKREKYWEVIERRVNLDYVPDNQREKLRQFFESLEEPQPA
jgi:hypothetical protein